MSPRLSRRQAERRGLRLWPVGIVLVLAFVAAVLVAAAVFYAGWDLLGVRELKTEQRIDSKTLFDLVKLSFGVVAGAGALVALVVAYRRQRVDEDGALRDATRLHTERFTTAVSQLGDESAAVRMGGVHALAGLADDAPTRELRQTCIDVLCAYLRLPYTAETDLPTNDAGARHTYLALREVRHTIIRLIRDHLRLPVDHHHAWQGHVFDFTGVIFDGGDFSRATFSGLVHFGGATFASGTVDFDLSTFSSGTVNFNGATFSGGTVNFSWSTFSGSWVNFEESTFSGGSVDFDRAKFYGGEVNFSRSTFSGSTVSFDMAEFSGSTVNFAGSTFSGSTVNFAESTFSDGMVDFSVSTFSGGTVRFRGSAFSSLPVLWPEASAYTSMVGFQNTTISGGTVDFSGASGDAPSGLLPAVGSPLPNGLILPVAWQPGAP
jgi:uncharacterized protein YjbI with pentapeptide repeats